MPSVTSSTSIPLPSSSRAGATSYFSACSTRSRSSSPIALFLRVRLRDGTEPVRDRLLGRPPEGVAAHLVLEVADLQLVAGDQLPLDHPLAVDPHPVGAAEVADHQVVVHLGQAAVPPRHLF